VSSARRLRRDDAVLQEWGRGVTRRVPLSEVPKCVINKVVERDGDGCAACSLMGLTPPADEPLELDHKQPLARGGDNHWTNLQFLCRSHNRGRSARPLDLVSLPAWLRRLARAGALVDHIRWCWHVGLDWEPTDPDVEAQLDALVGEEL